MRPRFLEIEGLQSFKEVQRIDFDKLGETGLFGIFGPTGSGKSTILDAITLALYGNVQRAGRGTQGIMNTAVNSLKVSFTFDLLKDNSGKTYRVDRTYKRKKNSDNYVESKTSRLIDVNQEITIADKEREVTAKVVDLLGLDCDDFTRSVVLPQNKFQEFLFLDKSKKRDMMERIFYLEEYGRKLSDKVNRKLSSIKNRLYHVEGAMSSLGDASEKALIQAEGQMKEAWEGKEKADQALKLAEIEFNNNKEIWELTLQKNEIEKKEQAHLSKSEVINGKKEMYQKAVKADHLHDTIEIYKATAANLTKTEEQLKAVEKMLPELENRLSHLQVEYDQAVEKAEKEIPMFIERRAKLNTAMEIQQELVGIEQKLNELRKKYQSCKKQKDIAEKEIREKTKEEEQVTDGVMNAKQQIEDLKTDVDYRKKMQEGSRREQTLKVKKAGLEEIDSKIGQIKLQIENQIRKCEEVQRSKDINQSLVEEHRKKVQSVKENYFKNAAFQLAQNLKEGSPCPVCGSLYHVGQIQEKESLEYTNVEEQLKQAEAELVKEEKNFRQAENQWIKLSEQVKILQQQLGQMTLELDGKQTEYDELHHGLPELLESLNIRSFSIQLENIEKNDRMIETLRSGMEQHEKKLDSIRKEISQLVQQRQQLDIQYNEIEIEGRNLREHKTQKEAKLGEITEGKEIGKELEEVNTAVTFLQQHRQELAQQLTILKNKYQQTAGQKSTLENQQQIFTAKVNEETGRMNTLLQQNGFASIGEVESCILSKERQQVLNDEIEQYEKICKQLQMSKNILDERLNGRSLSSDAWEQINTLYASKKEEKEQSISLYENKKSIYNHIKKNFDRWVELNVQLQDLNKKKENSEQIQRLLKGNSFIEFISEERLRYIAGEASETLGLLTKYKYALELDTENGFVIRDNANGGVHRMITSLSGGEVFLTSLALALALSSQIQLKGQSPLEFFFLDEGFGTLDGNLLDTVIDSLERLSTTKRVIGLISHVPELRNRICRRLVVEPPTSCGQGSKVTIEKA
ncbi:SMC family ATPase [Petroclostridium sp. X23]|uniref:AAA family ATPase n=1 Tax=Petroclostridium sp. X23 TaxID=3045146 RepID=UPI0024AE587E|nr:SMC family ATPase [Petroclostridium sp. X23]WHH57450.1 SMC family ATPase [Petroclostridium sp. X23]